MANIEQVCDALNTGGVIAYPTEGVFGVGCDPDSPAAIQALLELKQRPKHKGMILIAASVEQLEPYIDLNTLTPEIREEILASWPGPVTWVVPKREGVSDWVTGEFDSIAVRVTDHPLVRQLCSVYGKPLTSTSANLSGQPPCMTTSEVRQQLGERLSAILEGETGGRVKPTEIRDAMSGKVLRQG
ncbi:L-threonylcarbamoyladenylate synthase [Parasalinivibrio latis]|uniref:L-threonylcarbamoyladenylate synthase n=1 Tax=Parasalinivibrio latis TaxID=2952610 RepID=UPI0030DEB7E3